MWLQLLTQVLYKLPGQCHKSPNALKITYSFCPQGGSTVFNLPLSCKSHITHSPFPPIKVGRGEKVAAREVGVESTAPVHG